MNNVSSKNIVSDADIKIAIKRAHQLRSEATYAMFKSIFSLFKTSKHKPKAGFTTSGVACAL